jgi:hypothetical protein
MTEPTATMLQSHPDPLADLEPDLRARALERLMQCATVCTSCADACMAEGEVGGLRRCVRLDLDCADLCRTTATILARQSETDPSVLRATIQACLIACRSCGEECRSHADMHPHCRVCAEVCELCARVCDELLRDLATPVGGT